MLGKVPVAGVGPVWQRVGRARRWFEARGYPSAPDISPKNVGVLVLGEHHGLVQGLAEIGGGDFGLEVTLGNGGENAAEGGAEIAWGEVIAKEERRYSLASLFGGAGLRFLLGMEVTKMRVAGAARSATLAAIGKGQAPKRERSFLSDRRAVNFIRGGRAVVLLRGRKRPFSCAAAERPTERFVDIEVS